jgi:hypothetical protein
MNCEEAVSRMFAHGQERCTAYLLVGRQVELGVLAAQRARAKVQVVGSRQEVAGEAHNAADDDRLAAGHECNPPESADTVGIGLNRGEIERRKGLSGHCWCRLEWLGGLLRVVGW